MSFWFLIHRGEEYVLFTAMNLNSKMHVLQESKNQEVFLKIRKR